MMKLIPIGKRIIVDAHDPVDRTESGLWYSDYSVKFPTTGVIVAVGEKVNEDGLIPLNPGTIVVFGQYSKGQPVEVDGRKMYFMTREDINAVLE
jgi:co-chaperonin GroES (HSP10)